MAGDEERGAPVLAGVSGELQIIALGGHRDRDGTTFDIHRGSVNTRRFPMLCSGDRRNRHRREGRGLASVDPANPTRAEMEAVRVKLAAY
jgi:hypothetical protein